jgi:uncharacterized protein (DUF302 family)
MNTLPFLRRWRRSRSGALAPLRIRRPFRLWMTGSLAVVMAASIPVRDVDDIERSGTMRVLRHSRFGVDETLQRIEAVARDRGLPALARMSGERPLLVLSSSIGGTLVLMQDADSHPAMPLSVLVREGVGGGADVLVASAPLRRAALAWPDLPSQVAEEIVALPMLVDRALL